MSNKFFFRNSTVYEVIRKNLVNLDKPQMTERRVRILCWITKATNTHSEYVTFISFPLQKWSHDSTSNVTQNKIKSFVPSEHNIYNHQRPSMATCFVPFLDHPQANI